MADPNRRRIVDAVANASLAGVVAAVRSAIYRSNRERALAEVAQDVGAKVASIDAIAETLSAKAYDQLGQTEVLSWLQTQFSGQPVQNLQTLAGLYETHPWTKICSSYIAGALSGIPLRVWKAVGYEDGREVLEPFDDSPVGRMFRWINPQQSPSEFVEDLASWLLLTGEAYVAFARPGPQTPRGIPAEMFVMLSPFVEKIVSPAQGIVLYRYRVGGQEAIFDSSEVAYFKTFSPAGRYRGQAPATAGFETIQTDQAMRRFNRRVLQSGVHLAGVLETDNEDLNGETAEIIRKKFESTYSGADKAARIAVLWGGLKFNPTTILQKDIMLAEQMAANRDEIIALFGLKPELLTDKFANRATAETVRRMAYEDTILGRWGSKIESVFSATGLLQFDPDIRVRFDTRSVPALQTSQAEQVDIAAKSVGAGLMTPNEARASVLRLPPADEGEADVLAFNGTPLSVLAVARTGVQPVPTKVRFGVLDHKAAPSMGDFERMRSSSEAGLERAIRSVLRDLQTDVRAATASRSTVDAKLLESIERIFLFDGRSAIVSASSDSIKAAIEKAVETELTRMVSAGIVGVFDIKPVRAMARLNAQEQRIKDMMGKNWIDLRSSMSEGLANGETTAELNARTSKFFDGMRNNAATIARTEINPAFNAATQDVAIKAIEVGADVVSVWVTMGDEAVRTPPRSQFDHAKANGLTIVPGREIFVISGERMEYPGDSWNGASAANTINCRCGIRNEIRKTNARDNRGEL